MPFKKYAKKVAKKVGRVVKKRYFKGKGYRQPNIAQMVKDVSVLKGMLNAEKKRLEVTIGLNAVSQVNFNASGHWLYDLTPQPVQGDGFNQKNGNSIKWHSSYMDFQFVPQLSMINSNRIKIEIVKVVGLPYSNVSDILNKYIEPTSFIGGTVYDIHSPRDPDYFKNFVVLKRSYVSFKEDSLSGQLMMKRIQLGLKLKNHHVRTNNNDPTITMGQVFMIITAENGNHNATAGNTSTLTGVPITGVTTGIEFRAEFTHYYYDN